MMVSVPVPSDHTEYGMGVTKAEVYNTREWIAITPRLQHNHDSGGATGCRMPAALSPAPCGVSKRSIRQRL